MGRRVKPAKVMVETELAAARRELTEALQQQAATGEILRSIASGQILKEEKGLKHVWGARRRTYDADKALG